MMHPYPLATLWRDWQDDLAAFVREGLAPRTGWRGRAQRLSAAFMPPVLCCLLYRLSHVCCSRSWARLAELVALLNQAAFGASISPGSEIGGGLYLPHPAAVVLQVRAGRNLRVYAGASVHCRPLRPLDGLPLQGAPELGAAVRVGAKAVVAGPVRIGDGATVSFDAVVGQDLGPGASALQSPLRNYRMAVAEGRAG